MQHDSPLDFVDLSLLPSELQGQWVLLRVEHGRQEILASSEDIREVVEGQPEGPQYILTRVPRRFTVHLAHAEP